MRMIIACAALAALGAASAKAEDLAPPAKDAVADLAVINLCGKRFTEMFAALGTPKIVVAVRGSTPDDDDVLFNFGTVIIRVGQNQKIKNCFFLKTWKDPVRGIRIGDNREDVMRVLGTAPITVKDKKGAVTAYGYRMKDLGVKLFVNFDDEGKVRRVEISLPD